NYNYQQGMYQIWSGPSARQVQVDYPPANEYYDQGALLLLRQAFELYRRVDLVTDLMALIRAQAEKVTPAERVWQHLALCYLYWWNDEKDEAVEELARASEAVPGDTGLRFELASLHERQNDPEEALAVIEAITPLDHSTM